jgi:hypothetical protein
MYIFFFIRRRILNIKKMKNFNSIFFDRVLFLQDSHFIGIIRKE